MSEHISENPIWSSPLSISDVPARGLDVTLVAEERLREKLAAANGLVALASAEARLHVARRGRDGLHVTGEVRGVATQTCGVTLEPFEAEIREPVDVEFEPARGTALQREGRAGKTRSRFRPEPEPVDEPGMDDLDAPDQIVDGRIDLGALAAEFLTLGIDPYPRKPGVAFSELAEQPAKENSFAKLAALAPKTGDKG